MRNYQINKHSHLKVTDKITETMAKPISNSRPTKDEIVNLIRLHGQVSVQSDERGLQIAKSYSRENFLLHCIVILLITLSGLIKK